MYRTILCFILTLGGSCLINAQDKETGYPAATLENVTLQLEQYMKSGDYDEGKLFFAGWLEQEEVMADTAVYWDIRIKWSMMYVGLRKPDSAMIAIGEPPAVMKTNYPVQYANHTVQLARVNFHKGQFRTGAALLEEIIPFIEEKGLSPEPIGLGTPMINLGLAYNYIGEYDKALNRLEQARVILEQSGTNDPRQLSTLHYNLASVYSNLGRWDSYVKEMRVAHEMNIQAYGEEHSITANSLNSVANGVRMTGSEEEALALYLECLELFERVTRPDHPQKAIVELNIGETLQDLGRHEEALPYMVASAEHRVANYGYEHYRVERAYKSLAQTYAQLNRFDEAVTHIDTALIALGYNENADDPYAGVDGLFNLFYAMSRKAEIMHRKAVFENNLSAELEALKAYEQGIRILKDLRIHFKGRLSRGNLNQKSYLFYEPAIEMCFKLHDRTGQQEYMDLAFALADESKDNDYYDNLRFQEEVISTTVSSDIAELEIQFQEQLISLTSDIYNSADDSLQMVLRDSLSKVEKAYESFKIELETNYPAYYTMMYSDARLEVSKLNNELSESGTTMASYFVGDSLAFLFIAGAEEHIFGTQLEHPGALDAVPFSTQPTDAFALKDIREAIFQPVLSHLEEGRQLVIIPDGKLAFIPFEAFEVEGDTLLLHTNPVSYSSSAQAYTRSLRSTGMGDNWLGIAPTYQEGLLAELVVRSFSDSMQVPGERGYWINLPGARDEVNEIAAIVKGDKWLDHDATEAHFKDKANDYDVLHLSMHAWLDDENPMLSTLIFTQGSDTLNDGYLYAHEILGLDLNAEMAVLSACQTGAGKLRRGEGVLSIARAFKAAGVPSSIMSLWKVPDESTASIMSAFYRNLETGASKSEAMRQAKIEYLANVSQPEQALPYYWAGFVVHGNPGPLRSGRSTWAHLLTVLILCSAIALVLIYRPWV